MKVSQIKFQHTAKPMHSKGNSINKTKANLLDG